MSKVSRRGFLGTAAALAAASGAPISAAARETNLREPDEPLILGKPLKITLDMLNWVSIGVPLEQRYVLAARLGYKYTNLMDAKFPGFGASAGLGVTHQEIARQKQLIRAAGLEVATITSGATISVLDEATRKAGVEAWKRIIHIGLELGVPRFNTELGEGLENPKAHAQQMMRSLDELVPYMEKMGVHLDVEDHPNDFYETLADSLPLIAHYNSKALGYLYAIPHSYYYDRGVGDVVRMIRECAPYLSHVIFADSRNKWVPFRYNINPVDSPARAHDHYPYKTGDLNWQDVWDVLREIKFADGENHLADVTMFGQPWSFDTDAMEFRRVIRQEIGGA
jgi:myo-inositol catabolism protein IolH